jgi:imidazolonepropionase-like amidohydrolase
MGTDMGAPYMVHGKNAIELEQYVKYGATPMQAIEAATRVNAEIMRMDERLGTVEAGKEADLIVVKGDPLNNIRVLQDSGNVQIVFLGGQIVKNRRSVQNGT